MVIFNCSNWLKRMSQHDWPSAYGVSQISGRAVEPVDMADSMEDESRPMIGSILRFVSDWVGADARQPPPFRMSPDDEHETPTAVIEMQHLVERPDEEDNDPERERALREWKQIGNVDTFLEQAGNGSFPSDSLPSHKMPLLAMISVVSFYGVLIWQFIRLVQDVPNLARMRRFYGKLLTVPEELISTTEFSEIIDKVVEIQKKHPVSVDRLNAYDVSNRIMRRENYLIALFNKEVIQTEVPMFGQSFGLTKTLEWNLSFCILNFVFDESCSIRRGFLKDVRREKLSQGLQKRFLIMGLINLFLAPFIFVFLLAYFIFRYGEELYRNPKSIGMRQYTTAARWKLREFNELPHYFNRRLANSHRKATKYIDQFQISRFDPFARLVSFIAGSLAVVLIGITIANEDLLMHFEITLGKSVIWYVGLLGVVLTICRSMIPDSTKSSDPEKLMNDIAEYTHYMPRSWKGKLHTDNIRKEFGTMFNYKFTILFKELVSVVTTPFVLLVTLPKCTDQLVEFFREFSVHVDGIGYVCSFALFDFQRHGNKKYGGAGTDKRQHTRQGKMEKSFISFVGNNPNWTPHEDGS
ncbi:hypothetical protein PSACC_03141, partial [Paramicrosporidium saccamoebae]